MGREKPYTLPCQLDEQKGIVSLDLTLPPFECPITIHSSFIIPGPLQPIVLTQSGIALTAAFISATPHVSNEEKHVSSSGRLTDEAF